MLNFNLFTLINIALRIPAAFIVLIIHESVKARCSTILGDPTPKNHGLLSGKIFRYIEPIGFILTLYAGFGWGRPTPTSPLYYKDRKQGVFITFLTPSLVNLLIGLMTGLLLALVYFHPFVSSFLHVFARVNIGVALFNMIPVPPLDAAKLLQVVLSPNAVVKMTQNEKILQVALMLLVLLGVIGRVINPVISFMLSAVSGF